MKNPLYDRFCELFDRACTRHTTEYTRFLDLEAQRVLGEAYLPCVCYGGYDGAERVVAAFGEDAENTAAFPVVCVKAEPKGEKWADDLTHRDFLGALMGLGITRELVGDIIVSGKTGYILCLASAADFIAGELREVKRTAVCCTRLEGLPDVAIPVPEKKEFVITSNRTDTIIAAIWQLSRSEAQRLIESERVFINSRTETRADREVGEGDIVSVRGKGRLRYLGVVRETGKGRLRAAAEVW